MDELPTRTTSLTEDQVRKISSDPKNIVYEYTHDKAEKVKPVAEVKYLLKEARQEFLDMRKTRPELCDRACRRELKKGFPSLLDFSKTHPIFFEKITNRDATARDFQIMFAHLNLRSDVESGKISHEEASQKINMMVFEQCKTGKTHEEWQKEHGK